MVTKVNSRCYRFVGVDFEPQSRTLFWRDLAVTTLSYEESRLLEMLCYHAGQVLSGQVLYTSTSLPDTTFTQHQNNLCSLLSKSYRDGQKILPIHVIGDYGYRIDLPQKTYQRATESFPEPDKPDPLDIIIDEVDDFATPSNQIRVSVVAVISIALSVLMYFMLLSH